MVFLSYFCKKYVVMSRLYRSNNKILGGVCAGIADGIKCNVHMLRTIFVLFAVLGFGAGCIFYAILWLLLPVDKKTRKNYEERMRDKLDRKI